jgi:hypothetical protein
MPQTEALRKLSELAKKRKEQEANSKLLKSTTSAKVCQAKTCSTSLRQIQNSFVLSFVQSRGEKKVNRYSETTATEGILLGTRVSKRSAQRINMNRCAAQCTLFDNQKES